MANEDVPRGCECPRCGDSRVDDLVWIDDAQVKCEACGMVYSPPLESESEVRA